MFNMFLSNRSIRRHSRAFYNRTGLMSLNNAPSHLKVLDFLSNYKKPQPPVNLRPAKMPQTTDTWRQKPIHLSAPSRVDVCVNKIVSLPLILLNSKYKPWTYLHSKDFLRVLFWGRAFTMYLLLIDLRRSVYDLMIHTKQCLYIVANFS